MGPVSHDSSVDFEIEKLLGESAPRTGRLTKDEENAFFNAYSIIENNFVDLAKYANILEEESAIITSPKNKTAIQTDQFECIRHVHNYLSSLYSWNEIIKTLVNRYTPEDTEMEWYMFTSSHDEHPRSQYSRKVGFLRGVRTSFQHGDFSCLVFERYNERDDAIQYRLKFDRTQFVNGIGGANIYLKHTRQQRRKYPIDFMAGFHRNEFQHFYGDMRTWFDIDT